MRIFIWNYNFVGFSKKVCVSCKFEIVNNTVRFAALKGVLYEAEIMRIFIWNYNFVGFSKKFV